MPAEPSTKVLSEREFVLTHTFNAPAAKVFAAYTDPDLIPQWWAHKGMDFRVEALDVRPGGKYRFVQRSPDGRTMVSFGTYLEVQPVTRLVYTFATEGMPGEIRATVELKEEGATTRLTLTNLCSSKEMRDGMMPYAAAGAKATWNQLAQVLARSR